jgi:hypothetical protein
MNNIKSNEKFKSFIGLKRSLGLDLDLNHSFGNFGYIHTKLKHTHKLHMYPRLCQSSTHTQTAVWAIFMIAIRLSK